MPFYLLVSANRSCAYGGYGINKINMLYVVILFNFSRQCVGVVSLCEGFMAYAFLFAICWSCVGVSVHMV